jgi:hypothetical protein
VEWGDYVRMLDRARGRIDALKNVFRAIHTPPDAQFGQLEPFVKKSVQLNDEVNPNQRPL